MDADRAGAKAIVREDSMPNQLVVKKVAAFAHIGNHNLGDEATMAVFLQNVRERLPGAEVVAFTLNPGETHKRHNVPAYPIRRVRADRASEGPTHCPCGDEAVVPSRWMDRLKQRLKKRRVVAVVLRCMIHCLCLLAACVAELEFLEKSSRQVKGTNLFVVVGGGQLSDYFGGSWGYPFTVLKWCVLARCRGAKVAFVSTGAGPLNTRLGKFFLKQALAMADYRSFRDKDSRLLIESLGVSEKNRTVPDLVFGHRLPVALPACKPGPVGINPLPYHDSRYWAESDPEEYLRHVNVLASFASHILRTGRQVLLFPTQLQVDPLVIQDVAARIRAECPALPEGMLMCPNVNSFDDLVTAIAQTDLVVGSRYHGIILSLAMGRPVIGLAYNPKTEALLADVGLGEFVTPIAQADVPWLLSRLERLQVCANEYRGRIGTRIAGYRSELESQYESLFGEASVLGNAGSASPRSFRRLETAI
jgi:polysaccharide pyruvyl transferase WcaK-like protein